jgi:hypothetical protein
MRPNIKLCLGGMLSVTALFIAPLAGAQQKAGDISSAPQANFAYDVTKESVVQGTVISYTASSSVAPIGPHAKIQTSSGIVDVHLGNPAALKQNDLFLEAGDAVSIVGEGQTFAGAPVFLARVLRKGSQTVTLRSITGVPIAAKPGPNAKARATVGGAR